MLRRWAMLMALALSLFDGAMALAQDQARRVALVIGNGNYRSAPPLTNPINDANAISQALTRLGFDVIEGYDLDHARTQETLRRFAAELETADIGLFYYAGHGLQVYERNYIVPVDAQLTSVADLYFEGVDMAVVLGLLENKPRTALVFLDACRDNPLAKQLARSLGTRSTAVGRGLAAVQSGAGTLLAYATQPGNVAYDGDGENSPFTEAILNYIETPGLEIRQMLSRVRQEVISDTGGAQVPWDHSSLTDDFYFKFELEPEQSDLMAGPAQPQAGSAIDIVFWQSIANSTNAEDFRIYLDQFPSGVFAALAKSRLQLLEEGRQAVAALPPPGQPQIEKQGRDIPDPDEAARLEVELAAQAESLEERRKAMDAEFERRLAALDSEFAERQELFERQQAERLATIDDDLLQKQQVLSAREEQLNAQQQQIASLQDDLALERQADLERRAKLIEGLSSIEDERRRLAEERSSLDQRAKELEELRSAADERKAELAEIEAAHQKRLDTFEQQRMSIEAERLRLEADRAAVEAAMTDLADAPDPDELIRKQQELEQQAMALRDQEKQLYDDRVGLEAERAQRLAALDKEIEERRAEFEREQAQRMGEIEAQLQQREQALMDREQQMEARARETTQLEEYLGSLHAELEKARKEDEAAVRSRIDEAERQLALAQDEQQKLEAERDEIEKAKSDLVVLREEDERRRQALEEMDDKQKQQLAKLDDDWAALARDRAQLDEQLADLATAPDPDELRRQQALLDERAQTLDEQEATLADEQRRIDTEKTERLASLGEGLSAQQEALDQAAAQRPAIAAAPLPLVVARAGEVTAVDAIPDTVVARSQAPSATETERPAAAAKTIDLAALQPEVTPPEAVDTTAAPTSVVRAEELPEEPETIDRTYIALKTSNVRGGPSTKDRVVGRIERDETVRVLRSVPGVDWLAVELSDGREGFVYSPLLTELTPERVAALEAARQAAEMQRRQAEEARQRAEAERRDRIEREQAQASREQKEREKRLADQARAEEKKAAEALAAARAAKEAARAAEEKKKRDQKVAALPPKPAEPAPQARPPQLSRASLFGNWCNDQIKLSIAEARIDFGLQGFSQTYSVLDWQIEGDTIKVYWRDDENRVYVNEFGEIKSGRAITQIRGRVEPSGDWNYYNRSFRPCS